MRTLLSKMVGVVALLGCVVGASAQTLPNPLPLPFPSYKWDQRYTPPRATFSSRVFTCQQPSPSPVIAIDDWLCTKQGPILRIGWWGWLRTPAQAQRPFYVAIYRQDPNNQCRPLNPPIYRTCVIPDQVKLVAKSCQTIPGTNTPQPIYYMSAPLTPVFTQTGTPTAPQHYFLQISEVDENSVQFGVEDFRWAGRRPLQVCPAMQFTSAGGFVQPLLDACDQKEDDLAFVLFSRGVTGTLNPGLPASGTVKVSLLPADGTAADGIPMESVSFNFSKIVWNVATETGGVVPTPDTFTVDFDSPDGTYIMEIRAPGALPQRKTIVLQDGVETNVGGINVAVGDLNGDGVCNTIDLVLFLGSFGQSSN